MKTVTIKEDEVDHTFCRTMHLLISEHLSMWIDPKKIVTTCIGGMYYVMLSGRV